MCTFTIITSDLSDWSQPPVWSRFMLQINAADLSKSHWFSTNVKKKQLYLQNSQWHPARTLPVVFCGAATIRQLKSIASLCRRLSFFRKRKCFCLYAWSTRNFLTYIWVNITGFNRLRMDLFQPFSSSNTAIQSDLLLPHKLLTKGQVLQINKHLITTLPI